MWSVKRFTWEGRHHNWFIAMLELVFFDSFESIGIIGSYGGYEQISMFFPKKKNIFFFPSLMGLSWVVSDRKLNRFHWFLDAVLGLRIRLNVIAKVKSMSNNQLNVQTFSHITFILSFQYRVINMFFFNQFFFTFHSL